jgi:DNA-binding transcriptional LysR family regulator
MELRHLRHFIVLADELHFGNAARRLHITQPPLSASIRQLEDHLGARLFERDSRSVRLTAVGAAFVPEAIRAVAQAQAAEEAGRALAAGTVGHLHIAFTSSMLYRGMPEVLRAYGEQHPQVAIHLSDLTVAEQTEALLRQRIHAAFCSGQTVAPGLASRPLAEDAFVCCVHESHWAAGKRRVRLAALAQEDFVIFSRDITPSGYDHVVSMCVQAGFHPREKAHVRQWLTAALLVSQGIGIAVVPGSLKRAGIPQVKFVALEGAKTQTSGYFVWNPEARSPALDHLIALIP